MTTYIRTYNCSHILMIIHISLVTWCLILQKKNNGDGQKIKHDSKTDNEEHELIYQMYDCIRMLEMNILCWQEIKTKVLSLDLRTNG